MWRSDMNWAEVWRNMFPKQNDCSFTDSGRYSLNSHSKLTASHPSITASTQYHSRQQKFIKEKERADLFHSLCAQWKKSEGEGWKKLAFLQTWIDSAQLIKIKRFNSTEIEAAIQCGAARGGHSD